MKNYVLLGLLLAGALPGLGQGRDTAFAVRKLFRQKRGSGEALAATGLSAAAAESIGGRSVSVPTTSPTTYGTAAYAAVFGGVPFVLGTRQAARFSPEREAGILKSYAEGWPLPPDIRRLLRRKHFHRTPNDVGLN